MKDYKCAKVGPGGIRCTCCDPNHKGRSKKNTKQKINRKYRRTFNIEVE